MKKVILVIIIAFLTSSVSAKGPDPVKDTLTNAQLLKKIQLLEGKMKKVETKLSEKISGVKINLDKYVNENNKAVTDLDSTLFDTKEDLNGKLTTANSAIDLVKDSLYALSDSTGAITMLQKGKGSKGQATITFWIGITALVVAAIAIFLALIKKSGRRSLD